MRKKLLSLALALVMCLGLAVPALAAGYTEVIPCKYDEVWSFSEGLAVVELDGKWGYIDKTGEEVVPFKYDQVWDFSDGLALVAVENGKDEYGTQIYKYGYIDKTGKEVVPCKYDREMGFSEGLVAVYVDNYLGTGKWGFFDTTGKEVVPCKYDNAWSFSDGLAAVKLNSKWGFIDKTGKEVLPCEYVWAWSFSEGLAAVEGESGKYGYIDKTGKEVVPCMYDGAWFFSEGLAAVHIGWDSDIKCGYIDKTGKEVVPLQYNEAKDFSEGLAAVCVGDPYDGGKWGFIDKTGREVVPLKYNKVEDFSEGLALVYNESHERGYVDKTGKEIMPCGKYEFDSADGFSEGFEAVGLDTGEKNKYGGSLRKWGYIDKTGKEVLSLKYGSACDFSDGLAAVCVGDPWDGGKWGFIDKTGKEVVPCKYDYACDFSEGLAAVELDGKYGYIDKTGKEVVPCKYDWAETFSEGLAAVELDGKWGFIAVSGTAAPEQPEQPASGPQVSDWAKEQVNKAAASGLVPDGLGNDYRTNITRAQFAAAAVKLYEAMSGQKAPAAGASPFSDTGDAAVIQAEALGIVGGVGGGRFAPDALVTRQEAAAMLSRVYTRLGGTIPEAAATAFADNDKVSGWARDAVAFMSDKGIVSGVGNNSFDPSGNTSIEQALAIALRMFDNLK